MSTNVPNDPILNAAYNAGLEWAASWILGSVFESDSKEKHEFAKNMYMSIRAARRETNFQVDFFDAVRADPYMAPAQKEFWLSMERPNIASSGRK